MSTPDSVSSLILEHLEGDRWRVTIQRDGMAGTLDLNQAECDQLWAMMDLFPYLPVFAAMRVRRRRTWKWKPPGGKLWSLFRRQPRPD